MSEHELRGFRLHDVVQCLLRHQYKAVGAFFVVISIVAFRILFAQNEFASVAKLYIRVGRENVTLDPTATTGETLTVYQTRENEMNSTLQILKSRQVAELVADDIGLHAILDGPLDGTSTSQNSQSESAGSLFEQLSKPLGRLKEAISPSAPESDRSRAVEKLFEMTSLSSAKKSSVVEVQCKAETPQFAQLLAESWTKAFIQEHQRVTRTEGSFAFFTQQVESLKEQLRSAERELKDAKIKSQLVSIEGQQSILEAQIGDIRTKLLTNNSSLASAEAKLEELRKNLKQASVHRSQEDSIVVANESWDRMREKLFELQIMERELKAKLTPSHPEVKRIEQQRQEVESILKLQPDTRQLQDLILNEGAIVASLRAEKTVLNSQLSNALEELVAFNEDALKIADLQREVETLQTSHRTQVDNLEQTRIQQSLNDEKISSINLLQPASFVERPIGPSKKTQFAFGILAALFAGLTTAVFAESLNRSFNSEAQVERTLEVPVLASIPRTSPRELQLELAQNGQHDH